MTLQRITTEAAGPRLPGAARPTAKVADFKAALARVNGPPVARAPSPPVAQPAAQPVALGRGFTAPAAPDQTFRDRIAQAERSAEHPNNGYGQRNPSSGAIGRYQFIPAALQDIGWRDAAGGWTARAQAQGVTSEAAFLTNPAAQEAAFGDYLSRTGTQLVANGARSGIGRTVTGSDGQPVVITEAGLLAAAHRRGAGAVARWLEHRTNDTPTPPAQRAAFASIEARLRGFADLDTRPTQVAGTTAAARS